MAVSNILGLVLILLVSDTKADTICYYHNSVYGYTEYTGYCYQGCCGSQCCEHTTEAPDLDDSAVAAIVIGCVLGFALLVAIIIIIGVCCYYKQNTRNHIQCGQVLTAPQTYPLMFQGAYPHTPHGHLSPFTHNHTFGVSFRPSHGYFQSELGGQNARIEMTQLPNGQRNDPPGYYPDLETTQINNGRQNDQPAVEPLPGTDNETMRLATLPGNNGTSPLATLPGNNGTPPLATLPCDNGTPPLATLPCDNGTPPLATLPGTTELRL